MKKVFLFLSLICITKTITYSQDIAKTPPKSIIEALSLADDGLGTVIINQPDHIRSLVESPVEHTKRILSSDGSVYTVRGYRIQIYNGNLPGSKSEAYSRSQSIKKRFDTLGCYITYKAPFWRLLVGDFTKEADARTMLNILAKELPQYRREMYIVPSKVRVTRNSLSY